MPQCQELAYNTTNSKIRYSDEKKFESLAQDFENIHNNALYILSIQENIELKVALVT